MVLADVFGVDAAAGRAAPHLLEPLKSASYSSPSPRVKRTHAANQMKSVQRANGSLAQSGAAAVRPPLIGLGQVFVVPECPLPCQAHPHRESNEESPESRRLFGAVWGGRSAASTFSPSVFPAENTTKPICSRKNALTPRRRLRSPSGSPPENAQARSEQTKSDNRTVDPRTRYRRFRPTAE